MFGLPFAGCNPLGDRWGEDLKTVSYGTEKGVRTYHNHFPVTVLLFGSYYTLQHKVPILFQSKWQYSQAKISAGLEMKW